MTPEEWQRAKEILAAAILQPAGDRSRHVAELCGQDVRLGREIVDILGNYGDDPSIAALIREDVPPPVSGAESPFDGSLSSTRTAPVHDAVSARGEGAVVTWGEYTLLDEIGRGGFGVVHRAWDGSLKRDIALKVIDVRKVSHASEDTVLREGQMLARVRHPNVVTVYSARRIGREVGLAMEYIRGRTLSTLIAQQGVLNAHEAVHYGLALCDALAAVHREGLVHRDLKASNVMSEEGGRIVLMDFGAGREVMREAGTWSGLIGTPAYMPPEVLRGERATPTADIYSLGILLFHLVTGRYPVASRSFEDVMRAHATSDRLALAECRPDLPRAFVDAVERAMHPQADKRPQTAAALKRELDACLRLPDPDHDSTQKQQPVPTPEPRSSLLQRSVVAVGGIVLLCAAAGIVTTLQFDSLHGRTSDFANEPPLAFLAWGTKAVIGPAGWLAIMLLLWNVVLLAAKIVAGIFPAFRYRARALVRSIRTVMARLELDEPNSWARLLALAGLVGLGVTVAVFRPLLMSLTESIDTAPAATLAALHPDNLNSWFLYRRFLELDLLLLVGGLIVLLRLRHAAPQRVALSAVSAVCIVAALVTIFIAGPWRVVFKSDFRVAALGGQQCYVLGERPADVLLHCPVEPPPRNRVIRKDDDRLRMTETIGELFS